VIESVNGVPVAANRYQNNIASPSGTVTFTVDSTTANAAVIPVVFSDADNNNQLNLDADNQPTDAEPFGIGGLKLWTPPAAVFGTYNVDPVVLAVQALDFFTSPTARFNYDATDDVFRYQSRTGDPVITLTLAQWETYLSGVGSRTPDVGALGAIQGDEVTVNYNPDGSSTFTITSDVPLAPTSVTATVTNADLNDVGGDTANDDILVSWTAPVNPDVAGYAVYRAEINPTTGVASAYTLLGSTTCPTSGVGGNAPQASVCGKANTQFNDLNAGSFASGSRQYRYIVVAFNDDGEYSPNSAPANVTINAAPSTATPVAIGSDFEAEAGEDGVTEVNILEEGDAIEFTFNTPIQVADGTASITLRDDDGTLVRLTDNTNAQFSVSGANSNVLTIDVTGNPTLVEVNGGDTALDTNDWFAVQSATGITNANGAWNLPASGCDGDGGVGDQDGCPSGTWTRVVVGDNDLLPEAVDPGFITVNPAADTITVSRFADNISDGDDFFVYNAQGVQVAQGVFSSAGPNDVTVTTNPAYNPGDVLYFAYLNEGTGAGEFSQTTVINNPSDVPTVAGVTGTNQGNNWINVIWADDDLPDTTGGVGITQVGPASNYLVYDAANNVLVGTGELVTGSPTGGACDPCNLQVRLNANLVPGTAYVLRVAANTVQDPNNTPNVAEVETFTFNPDTTGPGVASVDAFEGDTTFLVTFNEAINDSTVSTTDFIFSGGTVTGETYVGGNAYQVTVSQPLAAGDTVGVSANSVQDSTGNTGPESGVTAPVTNASAPLATSSSVNDADASSTYTVGDVITIVFNEPMDTVTEPAAGEGISLSCGEYVENVSEADYVWTNPTTLQITITAISACPGEPYPIDITSGDAGIRDAAGNAWGAGGEVTLEDPSDPFIAADDADAADTEFRLTFNEPVAEASAENVANYSATTNGTAATTVLSAVCEDVPCTIVRINVGSPLASGADIDQTVTDTDGNTAAQTGYVLVP